MSDFKALLQDKVEIARYIYKNTLLQTEALQIGDEEQLLSLLKARGDLLNKLATIDKVLKPGDNQGEQDDPLLRDEIQKLFRIAYEQDRKNQQEVQRALDNTKVSLQQLHTSKNAMTNGYLKQDAQAYGYFLDKKN